MTTQAAQEAAPQHRAAHSPKAPPAGRDLEDFLTAAHRLRSKGWTEAAALMFFEDMGRQSHQRVGRRIRRMSDLELHRRLRRYESASVVRAHRKPRGDLMVIRSAARWPWRTSTSQ